MYKLEVRFSKKLGDSMIKLMWESDSQAFEVISAKNFYNKLNSAATPFLFTVIPAATDANES